MPPKPLFSHPLVRARASLFDVSDWSFAGARPLAAMYWLRCIGCDVLAPMYWLRCTGSDVLVPMYWRRVTELHWGS